MRIVDAFWDTKNLGLDTLEISVKHTDTAAEVERLGELLEARRQGCYTVVKVPSTRPDILVPLSGLGLRFAESTFDLRLKIGGDDFRVPRLFERMDKKISYGPITTPEQEQRLELEIMQGIFSTDRISLDPRFGKTVAARRYLNWLHAEKANGAGLYELRHGEVPFGFFALKALGDAKFDNFLAGLYTSHLHAGIGFAMIGKAIEAIWESGGTWYNTHVSSNNFSVFRLYQHYGFAVHSISYVWVTV